MKLFHGGRVQAESTRAPEALDILVDDKGRVEALLAPGSAAPGAERIDLSNRLVVPGLLDAHQHLDKSRTLRDVPNPAGDLDGAIAAFSAHATRMTQADVERNAERTIAACLERGTVAIRSHVNIDTECRLRNIEALLAVRQRWADRLRVQVVAFLTSGGVHASEGAAWLDSALRAGADVVGATPNRAHDVGAFMDVLFAAAERHGRPIDVHLDEHLDVTHVHFDALIERTLAHGMQGRVVASHSSVLSALPPAEAARIIEGLARADIGVVTLPAANLFLQGRSYDRLTPRGLTRVNDLARAGVTVACASDNIQDPFVPTGSGDLLEIARWTLLAAHLGSTELARAFDMVTRHPAKLMGLEADHGIKVGARADWLVTDALDAEDLVASGPLARTVVFGGRLLAEPGH